MALFLLTLIVEWSTNWYLLFRSQFHEKNKARELLKIVWCGGKSAYDVFVEVLLQSETQTSLGELLKRDSTMMDDQYGKSMNFMKYDNNVIQWMLTVLSLQQNNRGNH